LSYLYGCVFKFDPADQLVGVALVGLAEHVDEFGWCEAWKAFTLAFGLAVVQAVAEDVG